MSAHDDPVRLAARVPPGPLLCGLDFDGTIARIVPTPDAARPLPDVVPVLAALTALPAVRVVVVTGRTVADLRARLAVPGAWYVGVHGLEIQPPDGPLETAPGLEAVREAIAAIHARLAPAVTALPGVVVEHKGVALAFHYRLATPAAAAILRERVLAEADGARAAGVPLTVMPGHALLEIRPLQASKGAALLRLRRPGEQLVYVGDDETDEEAFRRLPPAALTVRVGPPGQPTAARHRLPGPEAVCDFLRALLAARRSPGEAGAAPPRA